MSYLLKMFTPISDLLLLLDTEEQRATFERNFPHFARTVPGVTGPYYTQSKSGKRHAYVKIPAMDVTTWLAL